MEHRCDAFGANDCLGGCSSLTKCLNRLFIRFVSHAICSYLRLVHTWRQRPRCIRHKSVLLFDIVWMCIATNKWVLSGEADRHADFVYIGWIIDWKVWLQRSVLLCFTFFWAQARKSPHLGFVPIRSVKRDASWSSTACSGLGRLEM